MEELLAAIVGGILGSGLTAGYGLLERSAGRKRRGQEAALLVRGELQGAGHVLLSTLKYRVLLGTTLIEMPLWNTHAPALAAVLSVDDFDQIQTAVWKAGSLGRASAMLSDQRIDDEETYVTVYEAAKALQRAVAILHPLAYPGQTSPKDGPIPYDPPT